ncbi:MAG: polysaccharide deacetylase family protein [Treponema sp.]|nr:polysaccharide deacetylase family protein [Treponema sp.]
MKFCFFKKAGLALGLVLSSVTLLHAKVAFEVLDLNDDSQLLFSVRQNVPGTPEYKSLFIGKLGKTSVEKEPELITCFPEEMEILDGGRTIQLRNRYGTARYSMDTSSLRWTEKAKKIPVEYAHTGSACESPDGKWVCYVEQKNHGSGKLVLQQVSTGKVLVLAERIPFTYGSLPVKWAPDSACLLYENSGSVYFATPDAMFRGISISEDLRKIGNGTINSVQWTPGGNIFYISSDIVYRIQENELYTRGLYSALVGCGVALSRLPSAFNPVHGRFWCKDDGREIVTVSSDKIAALYSIPTTFDFADMKGMYPLTGLSGSALDYDVFWSDEGAVLWIDSLSYEKGKRSGAFYRLADKMSVVRDYQDVSKPVVSPDRRSIAFVSGNTLFALDLKKWTLRARLDGEKAYSIKWKGNASLIAGGQRSVFEWILPSAGKGKVGTKSVLLLSSVDSVSWRNGKITSEIDGRRFEYDFSLRSWSLSKDLSSGTGLSSMPHSSVKNSRFRAYTTAAQNSLYENAIFVRSLSGPAVTYPLYQETQTVSPGTKKVSLVFDATESSEGLAQVLAWLERFGIKGTFFINGEFIRRCPQETRQILASGNVCASSFFSNADLLTQTFRIDAGFIKRGLARNEDEYFAATGGELALLWHAPNYNANSMMRQAGEESGYVYVDAWNKCNDRVSLEQAMLSGGKTAYLDAGAIIEKMEADLHDGMIIPVNVGNVNGSRTDYLYEKLDLLISTILDSGYEICELRDLLGK